MYIIVLLSYLKLRKQKKKKIHPLHHHPVNSIYLPCATYFGFDFKSHIHCFSECKVYTEWRLNPLIPFTRVLLANKAVHYCKLILLFYYIYLQTGGSTSLPKKTFPGCTDFPSTHPVTTYTPVFGFLGGVSVTSPRGVYKRPALRVWPHKETPVQRVTRPEWQRERTKWMLQNTLEKKTPDSGKTRVL